MKKILTIVVIVMGVLSMGNTMAKNGISEKNILDIHEIYQFIKDCGHYFIATVDEDQPHVRPFGTIHIFEDRLYVQTGRSKKVGRQLAANGKVEICAMKEKSWIRVTGVLVDDARPEAKASLLAEYPELRKIGYSETDENTMVLYFKPDTLSAAIWSFEIDPAAKDTP